MARALLAYQTEDVAGATEEPPAWLGPALIGAAALYVALFAYALFAATILKPYSDEYAFLFDAFEQRAGRQTFLGYLWHPHVGHHAVWMRLLTALEVDRVRSAWPTVAAAAAALATGAVLVGGAAWRDGRLKSLRLGSALACAMLTLTGFAALDAAQPINALYPFCVVFAVGSLILFDSPADPKREAVRRTGGLVLAMASALGNGAGLAIWPVLVLAALTWERRSWLWAAVAGVVGGLFIAGYLFGPGEVEALGGGPAGAGDGAGRRVIYFLDYLALPWSQLSALAGAAVGVALLGLAGWGVRLARARGVSRSDRFAMALILFSLGTAALAALGRGGTGEVLRTPMRYVVFAALLHVGIVMLSAPEMERRARGRTSALVLVVFAALLLQQAATLPLTAKSSDRIRSVVAAYEAGARTPEMTPLIYPQLGFAERMDQRLARDRAFGEAPVERPAPPAPSVGGTSRPCDTSQKASGRC